MNFGSVVSGNSARPKLQRYALRSSSKSKENKQDTAPDLSISSESKRYHFYYLVFCNEHQQYINADKACTSFPSGSGPLVSERFSLDPHDMINKMKILL